MKKFLNIKHMWNKLVDYTYTHQEKLKIYVFFIILVLFLTMFKITVENHFDLLTLSSQFDIYAENITRNNLKDKIDLLNQIQELKERLTKIEYPNIETYLSSIVIITNYSANVKGSGVFIKKNNKYYILSVNHLIKNTTDNLIAKTINNETFKLKIIKIDKKNDLSLFEIESYTPQNYLSFALNTSKGETIYVLGNPGVLNFAISSGVIFQNDKQKLFFTAPIWGGNSGGAVINKKGELVSIVQEVRYVRQKIERESVISVGASIESINKFLKDIK